MAARGWLRPVLSLIGLGRPIPMILFCPNCGLQHVDAPESENGWANPPHRSHLCHRCEHIWRPSNVETEGVTEISTGGVGQIRKQAHHNRRRRE